MLNSISGLNASLLSQIQQTNGLQNTQAASGHQKSTKTTSPQGDTVQISQAARQALASQKTDADGDGDGR